MKQAALKHANIELNLDIERKSNILFGYSYQYGEQDAKDIDYLKNISYELIQNEQQGGCVDSSEIFKTR